MPTLLIHVANEDPVLCEVDTLPTLTDSLILARNPRRRDGKDLHYVAASVTQVYWPVAKVSFIEIIPSEQEEEIIGFVRE